MNFENKEKNDKILRSLAKSNRDIQFLTYFSSESKIQLKKRSIWWYMLVIFFFLISFTIRESTLQLWSVAWLCIVPIISTLGSQEKIYGTQEIVFSCSKPIKRYIFQMVDIFLIILVLNLGIILEFLIYGKYEHIIAILVGMLFVISLASFFGLITGSKKIFELFFLLLFYLGPFNGISYFDFIGAVSTSLSLHIWIFYLLLSIILMVISFLKVKKIGIDN